MTYEMIRAMLVFWLDIGTIICCLIGKPRVLKKCLKCEMYKGALELL